MTQKECKKIIMGKHPDIKLPKLPEVIFSHAKFFYQYLFTTCFYEIKNISSLLISRKWIASLKKIISAKILNLTLKDRGVNLVGGNTLGKRGNIFCTYVHIFNAFESTIILPYWQNFLAIPRMK